jgi:hypothetical protein
VVQVTKTHEYKDPVEMVPMPLMATYLRQSTTTKIKRQFLGMLRGMDYFIVSIMIEVVSIVSLFNLAR